MSADLKRRFRPVMRPIAIGGEGLRRTVGRAIVALAASLAGFTAAAAGMAAAAEPLSAEAQLERAIADVHGGALTSAMVEIDRLIERFPNFRLAHLVRGDLLLSRAQPIAGLGNAAYAARERLEDWRAEGIGRARAGREAPPAGRVPRYLLQLDARKTRATVVEAEAR